MNAADYKLLLTNVEKYEAGLAGLESNDRNVWGNGYQMKKNDCGTFTVQYRKEGLKSRTFYDFRSALDFMTISSIKS